MVPGVATTFASSWSRYLRQTGRFPVLSPEDERSLARRWGEQRQPACAHRLAASHPRLLTTIAAAITATACRPTI